LLFRPINDATVTVGESLDVFRGDPRNRNQFNPKLGVLWNATPSTTVRAAYFRTLDRSFSFPQTIEPAQIAGFQQFFDDLDTTQSTRYGIGVDQKFSPRMFGGVEFTKRKTQYPSINLTTSQDDMAHVDGQLSRVYLAWTSHSWLAARAEYQYQRVQTPSDFISNLEPDLTTQRIPLGLNFYHPSGLFAKWTETYVDQKVKTVNTTSNSNYSGEDNFWLADVAIGYRLPKRWGMVTLEVNNLFDQDFRYHDFQGAAVSEKYPTILPERVVYLRLTLSY
jgi:outer membrane receptor protein involved in Fe transport